MRIALLSLTIVVAALVIYLSVDARDVFKWAVEQQRALQNQMGSALRALRSGDPGAYIALLSAAGAYGFVHAVGPGHGKYLIGGVGFGTSVTAFRILSVALASSVVQALWAITLVYGGFLLLEVSAFQMTALAENTLAPASYLAITLVGLVLVWRGARTLARRARSDRPNKHRHSHAECGCHTHGPSPDDVATLGSFRDAAMLIASIAIRPCTGAIFLLVIAWHMDIQAAGAIAVVVMGLGTAVLTSLVAVSSVAARGITWISADKIGAMSLTLPALQALAGALIVWISLMSLAYVGSAPEGIGIVR